MRRGEGQVRSPRPGEEQGRARGGAQGQVRRGEGPGEESKAR